MPCDVPAARCQSSSRLGEYRAHPLQAAEPTPLQAQPLLSFLPQTHQMSIQSRHLPTTPKPLRGTAPPAPTGPPQRWQDPGRSCAMQEGPCRGKGILTHAPDEPGNPAEPPVPPGHAFVGGGGRCLGGCCCCCWELLILRAHLPPAAGSSAPHSPPEPQVSPPARASPGDSP